jgi:uncharacterized protein (TIGR03083 family)
MADLSGVYDETRRRLSDFVGSLSKADQDRPVPAAPGWTVHDVVAHLTGDLAAIQTDDFPGSFFAAVGEPDEVAKLNAWTARMVEERRDRPMRDVLTEWEQLTPAVTAMLRGEQPLPSGLPPFVDRVLVTDVAVHEQDIYGALGLVRERDCSALRIGTTTYVAGIWLRLGELAPLRLETDEETYQAGQGEPGALGPAQSGADPGLGMVGRSGAVPALVLRLRNPHRGARRALTHVPVAPRLHAPRDPLAHAVPVRPRAWAAKACT